MNQRKVGAVLSYVTIGLQNLIALIYTPFLLKMLGSSEYGLYSLATSMISYLTLLDLGFGDAVIRYAVRYQSEKKYSALSSLLGMFSIVYIVIATSVMCVGLAISFHLESFFSQTMTNTEITRAKIMFFLLTVNLCITILFSVYKAFIDANEQFVFVRVVNILRIVLNTVIMTLLLLQGYKAVAQVVVVTLLNILSIIAQIIYSKRKLNINISYRNIPWFKLQEIFGYSFFIFINTIISNVYWSTGQFVLGIYKGTKFIAIYAIAIQLTNMYKHFTSSISTVFFPKITALAMKECNNKEISNLFIRIGRIQYIIIAFILSGFILFGQSFIRLWAGEDYLPAYEITLIFFIALVPPQIQHMGWIVTKARNQLKFRTITYAVIAFVVFLLLFPASKYWGMNGAAFDIGAGLLLMEGLILNIYYQKYQQIDIISFWKEIAKLSILPIVMDVAGFLVVDFAAINSWVRLGAAIGLYSVVYLPLLVLFFTNTYEKNLLIRFKKVC